MDAPRLFGTLADVLDSWRADDPDAPALIGEHATTTAGELADLVDSQTRWLDAHTAPGARIGLHAPNSIDAVALLYAVPASGRRFVPLNTRLTDLEKADQLRRAGAALLIGDPVDGFDGPTLPIGELGDDPEVTAPDPHPTGATASTTPRYRPDPDAVAWIIFTSGSTGRPKGVEITHTSLAAAVATTAAARPL
ncbi:MAG TPA: class I adenylate-forming enzyme family protein, partial [Acidimicrobiales bacterium]|nr:class I adenylate-forming enzyme family protein [Acidimicrobiales bacterium]